MLTPAMQDALNEQINWELRAHYDYLGAAVYFEQSGLGGFAKWMQAHSREEYGHAMKLYNYVMSEGCQVTLKDLPAPKTDFDSPIAAIEGALGHEQDQSARITALYELALKEKCYSTQVQLQWFITEQIEEEQTFRDILDKVKLIKDSAGAMMHYDHVMGHRE